MASQVVVKDETFKDWNVPPEYELIDSIVDKADSYEDVKDFVCFIT